MKKNPKLSVIIPAYNEEKSIGETLKSLDKQTFKDFEIILVDDGSTDRTLEVIKKFKNIKIIEGEHNGPGFSRNLGVKKSRGKILVFVDADMTFDKDFLKYLIKPILENKNIGTEESIETAKNAEYNIWSKCWGKIISDPNDKNHRRVFQAILKSEFIKLGGFDSKFGYADDQTFFLKYGIRPTVVEKAISYHDNPETLKEVYKQSRWIGASINNFWTGNEFIKYFVPIALFIIFPIMIPISSLRKCYMNKNFKIFFPWMLIFTFVKYFGTISGIIRNVYFKKNFK